MKGLSGEHQVFEAFLKSTQYLVRVPAQQDIWEHLGKFVLTHFPAEWLAFVEQDSGNSLSLRYCTLPKALTEQNILTNEARTLAADVLESGFLASCVIRTPAPSMTAFVPIVENCQTSRVMLIGHTDAEPIPKELLSIYLALAGLAGTTAERKRAEEEVRQLNAELEQRVVERTVKLQKANDELRKEIAERKRMEEALRENRELLRVTLSSIGDAVMTADSQGRIVFLNPVAEALTGWKSREAEGQSIQSVFQIINEQTQVPAENIVARVLQEGHVVELANHTALITKGGRKIPIEDSAAPIRDDAGNIVGVVLVFYDVTAKRRAQEALRESEKRYRNLFSSMEEGFCIVEMIFDDEGRPADYRFLEINPAFERQTGLHQAEGKLMRELAPAHEPHWFEIYGKIALTGEPAHFVNEAKALNRYYEVRAYRVGEPEQKQVAIVFNDISGRKRDEAALEQKEAELREAQRVAHVGSWQWDAQTDVTVGSDELLRIFGLDPASQCMPKFCDQRGRIYSVESWERVNAAIQRTMQTGADYEMDVEAVRADGSIFWVTSRGEAVRDVKGRIVGLRGTVMDITERKRTAQALVRSEKLASVGRMATTIAHEINNPLAAVTNTLFLVRGLAELPESARQYLDIADAELRRVAHITRQTLGFYREFAAPSVVSVSAVMDSAIELLKNKIAARSATLERLYDEDAELTAVAGELRQVFSNLLSNSLDAITGNGRIKLRVSRLQNLREGQTFLRVTVADNGGGIDAAALGHIFEPLFTTKVDIGTGLGLWVSKQIIEKHGGSIRVHSRASGPRRGTTFAVFFPAFMVHSQSAAPSHATGEGISPPDEVRARAIASNDN
jgi:PAS domain S-box-containing protein